MYSTTNIRYLTDPNVGKAFRTYRYMVEVVSHQTDYQGCPLRHYTIDCVLTEATTAALHQLLEKGGWGKGYKVVHCWVPRDGDCPF